jgi:muconolactone delta-isomerase
MLYHADFHFEYPASMSQKDFFSIWAREADAALGAKKAGVVIDIWKCVGTRRVIAVVNVDSPDTGDQMLLDCRS